MTATIPTTEPETTATGRPFHMLAVVEGLESSDGRMFELNTMTWREPPIAIMCQDTTPHGPGQTPAPAWAAGQIEQIARDPVDPSRILAHGHLLPGDVGDRAYDLATKGGMRGVSIDAYPSGALGPDVQLTAVDQDGKPLDVLVRYNNAVISRVTMVTTPAFEPCCIWFDGEDMPEIAANAHGGEISVDAEPEVFEVVDPYERLVASGGGPVNPPRSWFFTPEPDEFQPWTVTADGRITGHIARDGQCHLGIAGRCQTAPTSTTVPPYKAFHRTTAHCDDGSEVACGWLTVGTKHEWRMDATAEETADHYDHTGSLAAKLRLSNGRHGIWASGALCPDLADRDVWILQGPEVSPDWRSWQDPDTGERHALELVATLAVPFPAFPQTRTRPELLVASGEIVAMVGSINPCDCEPQDGAPMTEAERAELAAWRADIEAKLHTALVASGALVEAVPDDDIAAAAAHDFTDKNADGKCDVCGLPEKMHSPPAAADEDEPIALAPLTLAERASWSVKYDADARKAMSADGRALRAGMCPINDVDDLHLAIRDAVDNPAIRAHVERNATRLEATDAIPAEWSAEPVTVS